MTEFDDIKGKRLALIVVDMQNKYTIGPLKKFSAEILPVINDAISTFRKADRPVIFIRMDASPQDTPSDVTDPDGYIEGLGIHDDDIIVGKVEMSAFCRTDLADVLRDLGVDGIVVCGLVARFCVLSTYYGAFDHGISPYLLRNGTASYNPIHTPMVEGICRTLDIADLGINPDFSFLD